MNDFWAALCLVLVIEGMVLFAAPGAWKRMMASALEQPERNLSAIGGVMVILGILSLYWLRGG